MGSSIKTRWLMCLMLLSFLSVTFAQDGSEGRAMVDKLIKVYQDNGVDAALAAYNEANPNKDYEGLQEPLNQLGYRLLNAENDADAAAKVFMAQIEEYPKQPNPYDSYADAMIRQGNEEEAKKHLKKSIAYMDNMEDEAARKNLTVASKSKLARLEGKHKDLNFLAGNWEMKSYEVKDGNRTLRWTDDVSFKPSKYNSVIITNYSNEEDEFEGTQIMTYNAINDEYDVVRVDNNQLDGFDTAKFKIKEKSDDKVVMMETFEENGKNKTLKHVFHKKDGNLEWEIHEKDDNDKENLITYMDLKKKN